MFIHKTCTYFWGHVMSLSAEKFSDSKPSFRLWKDTPVFYSLLGQNSDEHSRMGLKESEDFP